MDDRLTRMFWIGGSPCSGKSTITDRLAAEFGFETYRCDDAYERHRTALDPALQPVFARLADGTCDDVWMRPIQRQISEERELYREEFPMILSDLLSDRRLRLPSVVGTPRIVAEGAALLPELLARLDPDPSRVIWIVPTEGFQRDHYRRRTWRHDVLRSCSDPTTAWENWMARDAGFARAVVADAYRLNYRVIQVDGSRSLDQIYLEVVDHFGLVPPLEPPRDAEPVPGLGLPVSTLDS